MNPFGSRKSIGDFKSMAKTFIAKATTTINAPPSTVWEALTKPSLIKQYLFGTEVTTDWQVGSADLTATFIQLNQHH